MITILYYLSFSLHRQKAHLQRHQNSCRINSPENASENNTDKVHEGKNQKCELCIGKSFFNKDSLKRHVNTFHANTDSKDSKINKKCLWCVKTFTNSYSLKRHISTFHQRQTKEDNEASKIFSNSGSTDDDEWQKYEVKWTNYLNNSSFYEPPKVKPNEIVGHYIDETIGDNTQNNLNDSGIKLNHIIEANNISVETEMTKGKTDLTNTEELAPAYSEKNSPVNSDNFQPLIETMIGSTNHSLSDNPENGSENYTPAANDNESKSVINVQKNNHENEPVSEILNRELRVKVIDFSICHCSLDTKPISTHFCNECAEGFCSSCVKAHQRFKVTRKHYMQKINYFCKCKTEEKLLAAKFCQECSEFFCTYCISAHQRLIVTKNHNLKSIFQINRTKRSS